MKRIWHMIRFHTVRTRWDYNENNSGYRDYCSCGGDWETF